MRYRLMRIVTGVMVAVLCAAPLFAEEEESEFPLPFSLEEIAEPPDPLGFGVWIESYADTTEINGGTYISVSAGLFLGNIAILDVRYSTDLLPSTFEDHLVAASAEIKLSSWATPGPTMSAGPMYLIDVSEFGTHHYVGVSWSLLHSWRTGMTIPQFGIAFDLLSLRFLWDVTDSEFLFGFSLAEFQIF